MTLKSFLASGLFLSAIAIPSSSFASEGIYFTGSIGTSRIGDIDIDSIDNDIEFDSGLNYEIGVGYDFGKTRIEASWERSNSNDVSWTEISIADDATAGSFLASVIYDFENDSRWAPFVGASIGTTTFDVDDNSDSSFSYGVQAGISYQTSENTAVFAKVNRIVISELDIDGLEITNANTTGIRIGTRFSF
tara:strand:+ start:265 stop:837 length:573 start_codon:yes stop_codon:yes gene_type:complete